MTAAQAVPMTTPPLARACAGEMRGSEGNGLHGSGRGGFEDALGEVASPASEAASMQQEKASSRAIGERVTLVDRERSDGGELAPEYTPGEERQSVQTASGAPYISLGLPVFALTLTGASLAEAELPVMPPSPQTGAADAMRVETTATGGDPEPVMEIGSDPISDALSLLGLGEDEVRDVKTRVEGTKMKVAGQETHFAMPLKPIPALSASKTELTQAGTPVYGSGETLLQHKAGADRVANADAAGTQRPPSEGWSKGSQEGRKGDGGSGQSNASAPQSGPAVHFQTKSFQAVQAGVSFAEVTDGESPGNQIASRVTSELDTVSRQMEGGTRKDGVLKVLKIELKPADLGTVTVRISLKDDVISLRMEASRHETVAAIERERAQLSNALKSAGYVVDEITAQSMDMQRVASRVESDLSMASSFSHSESQDRSGPEQGFSNPSRGQGERRATGSESGLAPSRPRREDADGLPRGGNRAIYV